MLKPVPQTNDLTHVQALESHKPIPSDEGPVPCAALSRPEEAGANDESAVKVAEKPEETKALLEVRFEYVPKKIIWYS